MGKNTLFLFLSAFNRKLRKLQNSKSSCPLFFQNNFLPVVVVVVTTAGVVVVTPSAAVVVVTPAAAVVVDTVTLEVVVVVVVVVVGLILGKTPFGTAVPRVNLVTNDWTYPVDKLLLPIAPSI